MSRVPATRDQAAPAAFTANARASAVPESKTRHRAAQRAWSEAARRIPDALLELAELARTFLQNLEIDLAERGRASLMTDVKPTLTQPSLPELLTTGQMCSLLGIEPRTVRRKELAGEIPAPVGKGRMKRWLKTDVERWLAEQENQR